MPMPVGGAFALTRSMGRASCDGYYESTYDPELEEFNERKRFMKENLRCTVKFFKSAIPPKGGKVGGIIVLEAKEDIEHSGVFILMKGLPQGPKKKQPRKPMSNVKFTVLGSTYGTPVQENGGAAGEYMQIEGGSRETYPLELDLPEDLPPPLITSEGKLMYKMQIFVSTTEGRHVPVAEIPLRWLGCRVLTREEIEKPLSLEQEVTTRRGILGLGRKRSAQMEWSVSKKGYLPGEVIQVELFGETKDKSGLDIDCRVEFVQKVWYQVPSSSRGGKMWVKMKVNILAWTKSEETFEVEWVEDEGKKLVWRGQVQVPKGITPTSKFDFTNSVCYTIRASIGVAGESKEGWVVGEMPIQIGSSKEVTEKDAKSVEAGEEEDENELDESPSTPLSPDSRGSTSPIPLDELERSRRRGSGGSAGARRSMSMTFIPSWARPRAGSVSSMDSLQSFASSTLSMFRLPPSYSQLSSRRPTLETLPPPYGELGLQEQERSQSQQEEVNLTNSFPTTPTPTIEISGIDDGVEEGSQPGKPIDPAENSSE